MTRQQATGSVILYVNGLRVGSVTGGTQLLDSSTSIDFGRLFDGTNYFRGSLDELAIYNTVLTPNQIRSHFHNARR